jgi:hypothetical protein
MTRRIWKMMAAAALAAAPLACATAGSTSAGETQNTTPRTGLLGRAEQYAGVALTAAKSYLSQTPSQQPADKQAAAQAGVSAANQQAQQQQGSTLSQLEQKALLDWVKAHI